MTSTKLRRRLATLAATALTASLVFTGALPALADHEIVISGAEALTTTEAGGPDTFDVVLGYSPDSDAGGAQDDSVTITIASEDLSEVTVDKASLTFTEANWATPQTVTVTGVDDVVTDGNAVVTIQLSSSSANGFFNGLTPSVSVTNTDNEVAGITLSQTSGLATGEDESTDTFTAKLDAKPTGDVNVTVASSDATEAAVGPTTLTFDDTNWNMVQTVTVTGVDDSSVDGAQPYAINLSATGGGYNLTTAATGSNADDDVAGVTVTPTVGLATTEAGGTDTFSVVLDSKPTNNVSIAVSSPDATEAGVDKATLTFTEANWNIAQTVTVAGVDDGAVDGNVAYTIVLAQAVSDDGLYDGIDPDDVSGTNADNDVAPPPAAGETTEFTDIDALNAETVAAIEALVELGITQGTSDTTFSPAQVVSRWQMALFLTRQLEVHGVTLPTATDQGFDDLTGLSAEIQAAIAQLAMLDVTTGTTETTYSPADGVNRWQMALFMTRVLTAAGVDLPTGAGEDFDDIAGLSPEAQLAIRQLAELGVVFGVGDDLFDPTGPVARWQMALFIVRTLDAADITTP